jgi:hypothetical protein
VDRYHALLATNVEQLFDLTDRFEDLERARVYHRRPVPVQRRRLGVDQMTLHSAAVKLGCQQKTGRSGTNYEYRNALGGRLEILPLRRPRGTIHKIHRVPPAIHER